MIDLGGAVGWTVRSMRNTRRPRLPKLNERDVMRAVIDFLRLRRWRCIRLESGIFRRPGNAKKHKIGETGMPDWLCLRPKVYSPIAGVEQRGCQAFFLELKAPGERPEPEQRWWMDQATNDGFLCAWADNYEAFQKWYGERFE